MLAGYRTVYKLSHEFLFISFLTFEYEIHSCQSIKRNPIGVLGLCPDHHQSTNGIRNAWHQVGIRHKKTDLPYELDHLQIWFAVLAHHIENVSFNHWPKSSGLVTSKLTGKFKWKQCLLIYIRVQILLTQHGEFHEFVALCEKHFENGIQQFTTNII